MCLKMKLEIGCCLLLLAALELARASSEYGNENKRMFHFGEGESEDLDEGLTSQLAESLAMAVELAPKNANGLGLNLACERIQFNFCASMPYTNTRMPNYFQDPNQIAAAEHAKQYEAIARTGCSGHLLTYLCELLAPICLDNDAAKKFEVLPCRSFCREVTRNCSGEILALTRGGRIPKAFDCDSLPFESNLGDGKLVGPCHEVNTSRPVPSQPHEGGNKNGKGEYRPYDAELEWNGPPFGTESSRIDPNLIRVPLRMNQQQQHQRELERANNATGPAPSGIGSHAQALGQQLALVLVRYSNVLSVLTLICLLLVVNAKRIKRLASYLDAGRRKGSSSSSSSSNGSQKRLAKNSSLGPAAHKLAMSPSSSSRSLVLVAADGKHARPNHRLVSEQAARGWAASLEPSQKLIQAGLNQRTLINVNGTLERQSDQTGAARYHLMQSALNNRDPPVHNQHQYDYIQHTGGGQLDRAHPAYWSSKRQQEQQQNPESGQFHVDEPSQVYSNILLSSPSHQVLLFSDRPHQQRADGAHESTRKAAGEEATGPRLPWTGPPQSRSHFITAASMNLHYAAPEFTGGSINRRQTLQQLAEHQRSFQRRPSGRAALTRHWAGANNTATGGDGPAAYATSGASTSSSSSGGSSSLVFSSGEPSGPGNLLVGGAGPSALPSPPPQPRAVNSQR